MRRLVSVVALLTIVLAAVAVASSPHPSHDDLGNGPIPTTVAAGPPATRIWEDGGVLVEVLGSIDYTDYVYAGAASPVGIASPVDATPVEVFSNVVLKRITIQPGTVPDPVQGTHSHGNAFVLSVTEGAICYAYSGDSDGSSPDDQTQVVVYRDAIVETVAIPPDCANPDMDPQQDPLRACQAPAGCTLQPGERIYLPAGSTLVQTGPAVHWYANYQAVNAVLYLAEDLGPPDGAGGCGSGCH